MATLSRYSKCSLNKLLFDLVTHLDSSNFIIFLLLLFPPFLSSFLSFLTFFFSEASY